MLELDVSPQSVWLFVVAKPCVVLKQNRYTLSVFSAGGSRISALFLLLKTFFIWQPDAQCSELPNLDHTFHEAGHDTSDTVFAVCQFRLHSVVSVWLSTHTLGSGEGLQFEILNSFAYGFVTLVNLLCQHVKFIHLTIFVLIVSFVQIQVNLIIWCHFDQLCLWCFTQLFSISRLYAAVILSNRISSLISGSCEYGFMSAQMEASHYKELVLALNCTSNRVSVFLKQSQNIVSDPLLSPKMESVVFQFLNCVCERVIQLCCILLNVMST